MLRLKEEVEDPSIARRIHEILIPCEFTRLDQIIEIAFAAVEDVRAEGSEDEGGDEGSEGKKFTPVAFHVQCINRLEGVLKVSLVRHSRASFVSPDGTVRLLCLVSRFHSKSKCYWFAFHPYQDDFLSAAPKAFISFGCGDANTLFLIPYKDFKSWLPYFNTTDVSGDMYWHVRIHESGKSYNIVTRPGTKTIDFMKYLLKP
jgi:hypothetical protein